MNLVIRLINFISIIAAISCNQCYEFNNGAEWWTFVWCNQKSVSQKHYTVSKSPIVESQIHLGSYMEDESSLKHQIFRTNEKTCYHDQSNEFLTRYSEVTMKCCDIQDNLPIYIQSVNEPYPCSYYMTVCNERICKNKLDIMDDSPNEWIEEMKNKISTPSFNIPDSLKKQELLKRVKTMFYHGYDSYIYNAYPEVMKL